MDGKIWLESELGKGSIFRFTMPLVPIKDTELVKQTDASIDASPCQ